MEGILVGENRFDAVTKTLMSDASRRQVLSGLLGGVTALLLGSRALEAKKGGKGKEKRRGKSKQAKQNPTNDRNPQGRGQEKVLICHKGHEIEVAAPAVDAHLRHGDTIGACPPEPVTCTPPETACGDTCVNLQTDEANCGQCGRACGANEVCNNGLACQAATCLPVTDTTGDVSLAANGDLTATTEGAAAGGNIIIAVPNGTTFGELATIESTFDFTTGTCAAGSPRFVVFLENGRCPYAAFPPGGDCADGEGSTGDLTLNNDPFVWNDDLCGGSGLGTNTYDAVLALYQNDEVARIEVVVDESGGEQTVTLDPCVTVA
jgi:hypothetical protein